MGRDVEWEAEQYLLGRCAKCAEREKALQQARQDTWTKAIRIVDTGTVFRHGRSEYIAIVETVQRMNAELEAAAQAQGVEEGE